IVTYTWLILYKQYKDPKKLKALQGLLKYSLGEGQKDAEQLGYIPLPQSTIEKVNAALEGVKVTAS
ncbi:MAG: phosphate ABC transporter substrate-binding protein PstS, partial [Polyangiales bacterium]